MFQGKLNGANFSATYNSPLLCGPVLLVGQLLPEQCSGVENSAMPYLFCDTTVMVVALVYFSLWNPYGCEKRAERAVLALLALSMILPPLDKSTAMVRCF